MEATIATLLEVEELLNLSLISSNGFVAIRHSILSSSNSSARKHEIMSPREKTQQSSGGSRSQTQTAATQAQEVGIPQSAFAIVQQILCLSPLTSLVLSQSTALKQSRHVSAVCCSKCSAVARMRFSFEVRTGGTAC